MAIPPFRTDGFLPKGAHPADLEEIRQRFGSATPRRRKLMEGVDQWVELARLVGAPRFLLGGSFVTNKLSPNDVDAVILLPSDFAERLRKYDSIAWEIRDCIHYRQPPELYMVRSEEGWQVWVDHFSQVRGTSKLKKGVIEVLL